MQAQVILYKGWYSPALCRACSAFVFVFGDNLRRFGKGGQAIIRSAPNAFGVPTKRRPARSEASYFVEGDVDDLDAVLDSIRDLWERLENGHTVVVPINKEGEVSLGLERAELRERAPSIYEAITMHIEEMCASFGYIEIETEEELRMCYGHPV